MAQARKAPVKKAATKATKAPAKRRAKNTKAVYAVTLSAEAKDVADRERNGCGAQADREVEFNGCGANSYNSVKMTCGGDASCSGIMPTLGFVHRHVPV